MSEERLLERNTAQLEEQTADRVKAIRSTVPTGIGQLTASSAGTQYRTPGVGAATTTVLTARN